MRNFAQSTAQSKVGQTPSSARDPWSRPSTMSTLTRENTLVPGSWPNALSAFSTTRRLTTRRLTTAALTEPRP
jgi:hypothetical protein